MSITNIGNNLLKVGRNSVNFVQKHPKLVLAGTGCALTGVVVGRMSASKKTETEPKVTTNNSIGKIVLTGFITALVALGAKRLAPILMKNPKIQNAVKSFKNAFNNLKNKIRNIKRDKVSNFPKPLKVKVKQEIPKGTSKECIDFQLNNFKAHVRALNEDRVVYTGTVKKFDAKIRNMYNELKSGMPQYGDYIDKKMKDFMKLYENVD